MTLAKGMPLNATMAPTLSTLVGASTGSFYAYGYATLAWLSLLYATLAKGMPLCLCHPGSDSQHIVRCITRLPSRRPLLTPSLAKVR